MAIKDKDGKVYKLRGPNPLVKEMATWDQTAIKLINIGEQVEVEIIHDTGSPVQFMKDNVINIKKELDLFEGPEKSKIIAPQEFIKNIVRTEPEIVAPIEIVIEKPVVENKPVTLDVDEKIAKIFKDRGVEYFCAPVIGHDTFRDDFYGSSYNTPKFGKQIMFDAVIVDQSDLQLQFWCIKDISKDSIVYRKLNQGGERWWRVQHTEPKTGGYLCVCGVSDINPDFS
jgi:hypothetical protein